MGGRRERKGGGGEGKKRMGKISGNSETIAIVVIILVNTCSFFCTLITSWQVGLAVSHPCLLPELSNTEF